jgi:hypothetical protein
MGIPIGHLRPSLSHTQNLLSHNQNALRVHLLVGDDRCCVWGRATEVVSRCLAFHLMRLCCGHTFSHREPQRTCDTCHAMLAPLQTYLAVTQVGGWVGGGQGIRFVSPRCNLVCWPGHQHAPCPCPRHMSSGSTNSNSP